MSVNPQQYMSTPYAQQSQEYGCVQSMHSMGVVHVDVGDATAHISPQHSPPNSTMSSQSSVYRHSGISSDHLSYSTSQVSQFSHPSQLDQSCDSRASALHPDVHQTHPMAMDSAQIHGNVGLNRVLTRRQARAAQEQMAQQAVGAVIGDDVSANMQANSSMNMNAQPFFLPSDQNRASTPPGPRRYVSEGVFASQQNAKPTLTIGTQGLHNQPPMVSPPYPSTPASTSSTFTTYGFHPLACHSRSTSGSSYGRSTSPAMSVMSAATSLSSGSSGRFPPPPLSDCSSPLPSRTKARKNRLLNQDRKDICVYSSEHPDVRQEDIAVAWGVERSTISKILKHKDKWLAVNGNLEDNKALKHRPSKFPDVEIKLQGWLAECKKASTTITDNMIRQKARDTAKELGIGDDRFKASSGWIENFKQRHGIRKGVWLGEGRRRTSMALRSSMRPPSTTPDLDKNVLTFQIIQETQTVEQNQGQTETIQPDSMTEKPLVHESPPAVNMSASPSPEALWQQDQQSRPSGLFDDTTPVATEPQGGFGGPYGDASSQGAPMGHADGIMEHQHQHQDFNNDMLTSHQGIVAAQHSMIAVQHDMAHPQHDMMNQQVIGHNEMNLDYLQYPGVCAPTNTIDNSQTSYMKAPEELPVPLVSVAEANHAVDKILTFLRTQGEGLATDDQANALYNLQRTLWLTENQGATSSALHHHDAMNMNIHGQEPTTTSAPWGV